MTNQIEGGRAPRLSPSDLLSLSGITAQLETYLPSNQRLFSISYNQLLEFLPGDLLVRERVKLLPFTA
jgi:hypothetical protein